LKRRTISVRRPVAFTLFGSRSAGSWRNDMTRVRLSADAPGWAVRSTGPAGVAGAAQAASKHTARRELQRTPTRRSLSLPRWLVAVRVHLIEGTI
jgi:hypothetical protein